MTTEPDRQKLALINLLVFFLVGGAAVGVARLSDSNAAHVSLAFMAVGLMVTALTWFQMRLEERERREKLEFEEVTRADKRSTLFNTAEAEAFLARRAREQFERFFIPGISFLLFLGQVAGAFLFWRWLGKDRVVAIQQPGLAVALFALFALVLFLLGKYSASIARLENQRLLRPGAGYPLLSCYLWFVVTLGIVAVLAGFPRVDLYLARALCLVLSLIALETLLGLLLEIYRPRVPGQQPRLLYESRLVGLLGQPEGLFSTAAHALDYQFGFKVSETWFYRFLERAFAWLLIGQLAILLLSTTFVFIETGEQALLERFGKPVAGRELLGPGFHFKLPWPIDKIYPEPTDRIQSFTIGVAPEEEEHHEKTVLWTVKHQEEFNLLVASRESAAGTNESAGRKSPPVNLLSVSIPVQFQVTNLAHWTYNNRDAGELLKSVATREVVRYLLTVDFIEIMSRGRAPAAEALRQRIQGVANTLGLGANIVFVGLQDIHPPVSVAGVFEKVVAASQSREAKLLAAQAHKAQTNALATATAFRMLREAEAEQQRLQVSALARAALFTNQIPAYKAAPGVYMLRSYLRTLIENSRDTRKYVLVTTNTDNVILFNLEDKVRTDLLDVPLPAK